MLPVIPITSSFGLPTYFLVISLAVMLSTLWFIRRAEARQLHRVFAIDLTLVILIAGFVGARLLHVFYEEPEFYVAHPWAVFEIWNGGFVFLGGFVAAAIAAVLFCQWQHEPFWFWADTAALPISLCYALGRLACFFNGCCYGKACDAWFAVEHRHPTQLYATFWELVWLAILKIFEPRFKTSGVLFNTWLVGHAAGRIVMEIFRDDPRGEMLAGLSLGIWMSAVLICLAGLNLVLTKSEH
jgi:phosphatidylglycerol:prolipoprotein diacylglycerol transferase